MENKRGTTTKKRERVCVWGVVNNDNNGGNTKSFTLPNPPPLDWKRWRHQGLRLNPNHWEIDFGIRVKIWEKERERGVRHNEEEREMKY